MFVELSDCQQRIMHNRTNKVYFLPTTKMMMDGLQNEKNGDEKKPS